MLKNYLKIAFRNLTKRKAYTVINLLGLTIGMVACLIIFLFVRQEMSYDSFHSNSERIFRVGRSMTISGQHSAFVVSNYSMADLMEENIPELETVVRISRTDGWVSNKDRSVKFEERSFFYGEPELFELFDFDFESGNPQTALDAPNKVVITSQTAEKYFGNQEPIGQLIVLDDTREFIVTAVVKEWPDNSHFHFDFIASLSSTKNWYGEEMFNHWGNVWVYVYGMTKGDLDPTILQTKIRQTAYELGPPTLEQLNVDFFVQPLKDIHLKSDYDGELEQNGSLVFVRVFIAVGLLILLIACFNFVNLATARASWRAKEVGLRKVVGAEKSQLVGQFLGESVLVTIMSLIMAIGLFALILPYFNAYSLKAIAFSDLFDPVVFIFIVLSILVIGLAAGSFPAFILSRFEPLKVLKGNSNTGNSKLASNLRRALVVIQFSISICLVVASFTIYAQMDFMKNKSLGFAKEEVVVIDLYNKDLQSKGQILKEQLSSLNQVSEVASTSDTPPSRLNSWWIKDLSNPEASKELLPLVAVDHSFVETMKIEVHEGRDFDPSFESDNDAIVLNQKAVEFLGMENPVGKTLELNEGQKQVKVIGVLKDFHFNSLHSEITPVMLYMHPRWYDKLVVRLNKGSLSQSVSMIEETWAEINPSWQMSLSFLDQEVERAYFAEDRFGQLILIFSILALAIGMLGLFGLASFVAEQKTKEIGIRKVMGASIPQVIWIQYRMFIGPLLLAFLIAVPVAQYFMSGWLEQFAYRIPLYWWIFVIGGLITMAISLSTVGIQSSRAARKNPVDTLRYE
ncbi:MAG: ABC transporter permease [Cyclobacteriaceae bacterium]